MPHKHNADRRHHIPKMAFKVENWPEYEAGLRRRGSLTLWIEDGALDHWQTLGPGGQARYADVAIQTTLMVRTAFKLALRQTEGPLASVITLMDRRISVPDHTTVSRRAVTLPVIQANSVPHGPLHLLIDSTGLLLENAIAISMDGRGAWRDDVFVEWLWRSVKYEEVYLCAYDSVGEQGCSMLSTDTPLG